MSESPTWIKSSRSQPQTNDCVEVALLPDGGALTRDSKDPHGPTHRFNRGEWAAFLAGVKAGEFDPTA